MVGPLDLTYLNSISNSTDKVRLIFLDGDRNLFYGIKNFKKIANFQASFLLMRLNFPTTHSVREHFAFLVKFTLALILKFSRKVEVKRLVFLRKSRISMFGQVRDPLPNQSDFMPMYGDQNRSVKQIGIVGTIDERKSIDLAIQSVAELGMGAHLTLTGQVTKNYRERLAELVTASQNVTLVDKYLSENEITSEIRKLDCFLVLQKVNAPSGTLLRALDCGVPIVVGGAKILRSASKAYPDLVTWAPMKPKSLALAIQRASSAEKVQTSGLPTIEDFAEDLLGGHID
jgi:glycosyltransferase involved in cell wall biosynthesis